MDEEGPFQGVLGLSEGASVAATLVIEDIHRCRIHQMTSDFKFAVFLSGAPAFTLDGKRTALADEVGQLITIPTCHMMGQSDPLLPASMALFNICDPAKAKVVTQVGGHRSPREQETIQQIGGFIKKNR